MYFIVSVVIAPTRFDYLLFSMLITQTNEKLKRQWFLSFMTLWMKMMVFYGIFDRSWLFEWKWWYFMVFSIVHDSLNGNDGILWYFRSFMTRWMKMMVFYSIFDRSWLFEWKWCYRILFNCVPIIDFSWSLRFGYNKEIWYITVVPLFQYIEQIFWDVHYTD